MNIIRKRFANNTPLFIPFVMAGHPTRESTVSTVLTLAKQGADIIELGVPFSDPLADGPIIQQAAQCAIENGTTLATVLEQVGQIREQGCQVPIVLFSYINPILAMGTDVFLKKARQVNVNGLLVVDLSHEEGHGFYLDCAQYEIAPILIASPTTDLARLQQYDQYNLGFLYYISRLGVTGVQPDLSHSLMTEIKKLRQVFSTTPIAVGFGISTPDQAHTVAQVADGVIVGSALVKIITEKGANAFEDLVLDFKKSITNNRLTLFSAS